MIGRLQKIQEVEKMHERDSTPNVRCMLGVNMIPKWENIITLTFFVCMFSYRMFFWVQVYGVCLKNCEAAFQRLPGQKCCLDRLRHCSVKVLTVQTLNVSGFHLFQGMYLKRLRTSFSRQKNHGHVVPLCRQEHGCRYD
ncbi:hypothetical protein ANANG_G00060960 [Anguilla anguilla]|uniref:Uncharacterized protein n=1 Tax=Anguilla anguilla TaxID=7936 RepID=A0A9D3MQU0_ANGAN|nr:hypothetical protein ANANG_G00060960 [Anguilla anguilla]